MAEARARNVTEAMSAARKALEQISMRVIGEVSEFSDKPGYKAAYFTVSDGEASMPCLMWRDAYQASGVRLECGALVEMEGRFSAYIPKGRMQFQVKRLALAGEGVLRMQVAAIAKKLEAEGMMKPERRQALPEYPLRIAVVTSPRGKAIHDVVRTLKRRYPVAELLVAGVAVEGAGAADEIVEGLRVAGSSGAEVVLLVRGGGSYEDLMPFNAEAVARAIVECPVPVVTGIGHEPDTSIADMVADVRASTPTAAAEAAAPSIEQMGEDLDQASHHLGRALLHRVREAEHRVAVLARRPIFSDCNAVVGLAAQRLDVASQSLHVALPNQLRRDRDRVGYAARALAATGPRIAERAQESVALAAARLDDLSPLKVLGRGWSMCFADDGTTVVRSIDQVEPGNDISVRVEDGKIGCRVETTEARETHE